MTCSFVLHCDNSDYDKCRALADKSNEIDIETIHPTDNLLQMFHNINQCDIFIAGSTGPLHVAAALNKKTVGFYPSKLSSIGRGGIQLILIEINSHLQIQDLIRSTLR